MTIKDMREGKGSLCPSCKDKGITESMIKEPILPQLKESHKDRVRRFFNHKCFLCGKTEDENKQKLSIHRIPGENIAFAVCKSCNNKIRSNVKYWENVMCDNLSYFNLYSGIQGVCPICKSVFIPIEGHTKYCSPACKTIGKIERDELAREKYELIFESRNGHRRLDKLLGSCPIWAKKRGLI